jgi:hypothetical protein
MMTHLDRRAFLKSASAGAILVATTPFRAWGHPPVAGRTDQHDATAALAHVAATLRGIEQTPGYSPPVASRYLAYLGTALYAAVAPGMPGYRPLSELISGFPEIPQVPRSGLHWPIVANHAIGTTLASMVPSGSAIEALTQMTVAEQDRLASVPAPIRRRSIERGEVVGDAIANWAARDGGHNGHLHNFPAGYTPPAGPGLWEPTPPEFLEIPLQPFWGQNRPFMHGGCEASAPPTFSVEPNSEFYGYATQVYQVSQVLTQEQVDIARFWADDPGTITPPGHSLSLTAQLLADGEASLALAAETLVRVGCAVADAFIQCWRTKFHWNLVRPVTYIRSHIDESWSSIVTTPPFPEYNSGHSTQAGAWAEVMTALFGDAHSFTDHSHIGIGLAPRTFPSFREAADEAAVSRLYGGIHYEFGNESGIEAGRCIGRAVAAVELAA